MPAPDKPPIYTVLTEVVGWTLDRTASLPKSSRFTFGQRLDNRSLDALELTIHAIFSPPARKRAMLEELNLLLEPRRVLWRLCQERGWLRQLSSRPDPRGENP